MAIATNQEHFRIRTDATAAQGGTPVWAAAVDTNPTSWSIVSLSPFRIRFSIANTGSTATASSLWNIFVCRNGGTTGTYTAVTTSSSFVKSIDATGGLSADNSSISTELLGVIGSDTFVNGQYDDTGSTVAQVIGATSYTEFEFGLEFTSAVLPGDTYAFRVYIASVALPTYTVTPLITITVVPITAALVPAPLIKGNAAQLLKANTALSPVSIFVASAIQSYGVVNLSSTQPRQDTLPSFNVSYVLTATNLACSAAYIAQPTVYPGLLATTLIGTQPREDALVTFNIMWAGATALIPSAALIVTTQQLQVAKLYVSIASGLSVNANEYQGAAAAASVSASLGAAASTFIFDSESYAIATGLVVNINQKQVAALNASDFAALLVTEHIFEVAALNASIATSLSAVSYRLLTDLSESLKPATALIVTEHQYQVAALSVAVASNLVVTENQRKIAALSASVLSNFVVTESQRLIAAYSASVISSLGANALTYIIDSSELLAPITNWTIKEHVTQVAALNAAISSALSVTEKQNKVAALNASISAALGASTLTFIFDSSEALSPLSSLAVTEHQYLVAAFNASITSTLGADVEFVGTGISLSALLTPLSIWSVREFQYQVAAFNAAVSSVLAVTERQADSAGALLSPAALSSATAAQLDVTTVALAPASVLGASGLTFLFDTAETLSALSVVTFSSSLFEAAKSALTLASALGANAQNYIFDLAEHLSPLSSLGANAKTFIFDTESFAPSASLGANTSEIYGFTALNLDCSAAFFDQPTIAVSGELICVDIETTADNIGEPLLTTVYGFAATNLAPSAAALGIPLLATVYPFVAVNLVSEADLIGSAAFNQDDKDTASNLACGPAAFEEPLLDTTYTFAATNLTSASVAIGEAIFNQSDTINSVNVATSSDDIGSAALTTKYNFAASFATGSASLGAPNYSKIGTISASSIQTGTCALGTPQLGFSFPLVAQTISSGNINIGTERPVFFADNRSTLYNTMRRLQGISRAAETRGAPAARPPFTPAQIRKQKAFSENYMRRFDRE